MARTIDTFFDRAPGSKLAVCYTLDSASMIAFFSNEPPPGARFLGAIKGLRLLVRGDEEGHWTGEHSASGTEHVPVLKSNLQKAVRRGLRTTARWTTRRLLTLDATSLLRRLPIIAVEDVAPIKGTATIVWLMAAAKYRRVTPREGEFIIDYVDRLCTTDQVAKLDKACPDKPPVPPGPPGSDTASALRLRATFGGMKGDMRLLEAAARGCQRGSCSAKVEGEREEGPEGLIPEAIDFHPYPGLVFALSNKTGIAASEIKRLIWLAESAVNIRKPRTLRASAAAKKTVQWATLSPLLSTARRHALEPA